MNSPYYKRFRVTQEYKKGTHDGIDLVGIDSKDIHSTINGTVIFAGWENINNQKQGFGKYIKIKHNNTYSTAYGHLDSFNPELKKGSFVKKY